MPIKSGLKLVPIIKYTLFLDDNILLEKRFIFSTITKGMVYCEEMKSRKDPKRKKANHYVSDWPFI